MKYLLSILLLYCFLFVSGQRLHDPSEILRMMDDSKVKYKMVELDSVESTNKYSLIRGWPEENNGIFTISPYVQESNTSFQKNYVKAEKYYRAKRWSKAIKYYKKNFRNHPENVPLLLRIGASYAQSEDYMTAIYWYKQAIAINFHDFKAHQLLAEAHLANKDFSNAKRHILLAHLLNRLDERILTKVKHIFNQNNSAFAEWELLPKSKVTSPALGQVTVAAKGSPWKAYANVIAIWDFEPQHRIRMAKISNQNGALIQLKEALLNALIIYDELKPEEQGAYPELECLKKALHGQFLNEYLVYEKLSLTQPTMLYGYNQAGLQRFVDYLMKYRVSQKNNKSNGSK